MTVWLLRNDSSMTAWWLSNDCLMTDRWLPNDCWLSDYCQIFDQLNLCKLYQSSYRHLEIKTILHFCLALDWICKEYMLQLRSMDSSTNCVINYCGPNEATPPPCCKSINGQLSDCKRTILSLCRLYWAVYSLWETPQKVLTRVSCRL